jgi:ribosomal protein L11 methyltransferase
VIQSTAVPYRIDFRPPSIDAVDRLVELGALDIDWTGDGALSALLPDNVTPEQIATALPSHIVAVSPAVGRDADSVWVLKPRPVRIGRVTIVAAHDSAAPDAVQLIDSRAFGTGLHPTTALCLEALDEAVGLSTPDAVLDVGTGSGVLALAAIRLGVPRAVAIDIDEEALRVAAENARLNSIDTRLLLARGGPDALGGTWPLVMANILAAPLIEMAPTLVRRVARHGRLILSGIPRSVEPDVDRAYRRLGLHRVEVKSRAGWVALVLQASW